ncbi:anthranilate synthase component II [Pontibacillus yanchengensis]|uniref:Anthranilate synthase component II n=1 Tax=Pontibacillus yanchengensis Y32 TaxID=1385514 RepID=A0A0A2TDS4_9BACI|nr:aminodeoxychorismate/anthranilate synthase component II [Pontibacillus yanchengensis]KGP73694.1 anthranilate synthase component II [Pontibacillus yanchengensis Y32]
MILIIDNYDSFTYNLVQYIGEMHSDITVRRNDEIDVDEVEFLQPEAIVLSPGPCTPNEAGVCLDIVKTYAGSIPILGVCLGHQSIIQAFGGKIVEVKELFHGKTSQIIHDGQTIYNQIPSPYTVGRYHSLIANEEDIPDCLTITSKTADGEIMGVRHVDFAVEGVQFHPESILTTHGKKLLKNFLDYYRIGEAMSVK